MREFIQLLFLIMPILIIYLICVCNRLESYCKTFQKKLDILENIIKETDDHVDKLVFYNVDKDSEK